MKMGLNKAMLHLDQAVSVFIGIEGSIPSCCVSQGDHVVVILQLLPTGVSVRLIY